MRVSYTKREFHRRRKRIEDCGVEKFMGMCVYVYVCVTVYVCLCTCKGVDKCRSLNKRVYVSVSEYTCGR